MDAILERVNRIAKALEAPGGASAVRDGTTSTIGGDHAPTATMTLRLRRQEAPLDDPRSRYFFTPHAGKPFRVTAGALRTYTRAEIAWCLATLQNAARAAGGLEYAQAFDSDEGRTPLWFIEDAGEGAITALLPSEY